MFKGILVGWGFGKKNGLDIIDSLLTSIVSGSGCGFLVFERVTTTTEGLESEVLEFSTTDGAS